MAEKNSSMSPFSQHPKQTVAAWGETRLIAAIRRWLGSASPPAPFGMGDDCAILPEAKGQQAITVDPVIYGRHFDAGLRAASVGEKLLKRNLSDLAAMGATPSAAVVALILDRRVRLNWLEGFYRGLAACARRYRVPIVGGDIAQADGALSASLTLLGRSAGSRMVTRAGARIGDWIYVTGQLGGSLRGHHFRFTPRLAEGAWLAARREVRAMIDVSDGLAKDVRSVTPPGAQAAIVSELVPISAAARQAARKSKRTPLDHAASDGEDYELLFALGGKTDRAAFERSWRARFKTPLACIGRFAAPGERSPEWLDLSAYHGYEHLH
jgi:thiamine-monophosphate kinase